MLGQLVVEVKYQEEKQSAQLTLLVAKGEGPNLLGHDWLKVICLDWKAVSQVRQSRLHEILDQYFQTGLGSFKGYRKRYEFF